MIKLQADAAIVGSGFGGSLMALILQRLGLRLVLIDRTSHPRFAIGESSTPNADLTLLQLAREYDLPRLAALAKYGTWQAMYPQVVCGLKRGFSYFHHRPGKDFQPAPDHGTELLVTASPDDDSSDTHWLRADVDALFAAEAAGAGVPLLENTTVDLVARGDRWRLTGSRHGEPVEVDADFIIDGTGEIGLVPRTLGICSLAGSLATNSRTIFAHFKDLAPWEGILLAAGGQTTDHPFCCDNAAVHHVIDEGWMYQLRFNNGVTSAGFVVDIDQCPLDCNVPVADEWRRLLDRYPAIARQFDNATIVAPSGGLTRTSRLQRRLSRLAGPNWALLPHTGGFIDPLHSTGIAQTLAGVERLAAIFRDHWRSPKRVKALSLYAAALDREIVHIDKIVSGCYLGRRNFRLFSAFTMLYFAAATVSEHRRASGQRSFRTAFLLADEQPFRELVAEAWRRMRVLFSRKILEDHEICDFELFVARGIEPYNIAGLCNPSVGNMYRYTAIAKP